MTIHLSERKVMRQVADYLLARGILFFRQNTGKLKTEAGHWVRFGGVGMADLLAFPILHIPPMPEPMKFYPEFRRPHPLWIETKSSSGRQRPEQISFQKIVEDNGHGYILARGYEDVESWLKARGL